MTMSKKKWEDLYDMKAAQDAARAITSPDTTTGRLSASVVNTMNAEHRQRQMQSAMEYLQAHWFQEFDAAQARRLEQQRWRGYENTGYPFPRPLGTAFGGTPPEANLSSPSSTKTEKSFAPSPATSTKVVQKPASMITPEAPMTPSPSTEFKNKMNPVNLDYASLELQAANMGVWPQMNLEGNWDTPDPQDEW